MLDLDLPTFLARVLVLFTAFAVHEFAHAWTADYFGDDTPRVNGRLTLNPFAHLDPLGSILLLFAGFGWARPVPVNPYALERRSPAALMWVSLAGPLSNLLMAVLAAVPFRLGLVTVAQLMVDMQTVSTSILPTLPYLLFEFVSINLLLMLFNLIPLAPLDGEKIAAYVFPPRWADFLDSIRPYGPVILLLLVFGGPLLGVDVLGWVIFQPLGFLVRLLLG